MKYVDCALCYHGDRAVVERMLSKGERLSYLTLRFGLNVDVLRVHREHHMDPVTSTDFASPQNILYDLQEARLRMQGLMDFALTPGAERPALAIQAVNTLVTILGEIDKQVSKVRTVEVNSDALLLKDILLEEFVGQEDAPVLARIQHAIQRKMLTHEEE